MAGHRTLLRLLSRVRAGCSRLPSWTAPALGAALVLWRAVAEAQSTGGSFGGGDFSSRSSDDHDGPSPGGGGGGGGLISLVRLFMLSVQVIGLVPTLIIFGLALAAWVWFSRHAPGSSGGPGSARPGRYDTGYGAAPAPASPAWNQVDSSAVRVSFDAAGRAAFQRRFDEATRGAEARSKHGQVRVVRALTEVLEASEPSWRQVGVSNFHPMSSPVAEHHFRRLSQAARAEIEDDSVAVEARAGEGEGDVGTGQAVLTLIVAARKELRDLHGVDSTTWLEGLRALRSLTAQDLVALDIVWSPAADTRTWSPAQAARRYPAMRPVRRANTASATTCSHCRSLYDAGQRQCPRCGAPNPAVR